VEVTTGDRRPFKNHSTRLWVIFDRTAGPAATTVRPAVLFRTRLEV